MAKVQITITDVEDQEGAVHMDYAFDPELPKAQEGSDKIPLTYSYKKRGCHLYYQCLRNPCTHRPRQCQKVGLPSLQRITP